MTAARYLVTEHSKAVFLSYASEDADAALRICTALRAAGIEVWFDQSELRGGDAWDAAIRRQIKNCGLFIPVISKNTHLREEGYFRLEWKIAVDRSHLMTTHKAFLLPVVIDDTTDDDENVPERFLELHWTRLPGGETPSAFTERILRLLLHRWNRPTNIPQQPRRRAPSRRPRGPTSCRPTWSKARASLRGSTERPPGRARRCSQRF